MGAHHEYSVAVRWPAAEVVPGGADAVTSSYTAYTRDHDVVLPGRPVLPGSADPSFRGDPDRFSPEDLFVASLSQCHMLWFLHLAAESGLAVREYTDDATGTMRVEARGEGQFTDVTLRPRVVVEPGERATDEHVEALHHRAHALCFLSRSVNFSVLVEPAPLHLADAAA
ncbi:organic hydroperoxide reductase OsmC/OhrA [Isoptericola sp. CG 20/1183]|uniref:Organic hydroperoxide reductase OsmC/OhrA n=1 Tax=Isoptericola halotolerans TaxID=300560 RepID=A0ABX5EAA0_9MICO|nr:MULTISPECIES: OsmC family protein [Isoptericola]MCK0115768.1 OsmC family protein [Isoptericola sp. S6320L]PRZ03473.1 organic hydroperoxide reductase OsmC/OhrA [Isoptericola sp. CG 20/1183]PRZ03760.1 organic hydroperoxide reductase OsmC/OhrA [Isoptericola halotolerans]